jgi:hypothetical protein
MVMTGSSNENTNNDLGRLTRLKHFPQAETLKTANGTRCGKQSDFTRHFEGEQAFIFGNTTSLAALSHYPK